jgi:transcriptional regulator with XRE-family HTH domain
MRVLSVGDAADKRAVPDESWQDVPLVPRVMLGRRLRGLREACGLSQAEASRVAGVSRLWLTALEEARSVGGSRAVTRLLRAYGVEEEAETGEILALVDQAARGGWWESYRDLIPGWARPYLELEQAAGRIRGFETQFVPGLLQTADYARAVIEQGCPGADATEVARRVELRTARQRILHRAAPPHLWVVVDEAALRRSVGGPGVMRAQLEHLIRLHQRLPRVTIQVLPFEAGGWAGACQPVTLLRLPYEEYPDVVYLEPLSGGVCPPGPAERDYYRHVMNRLVTEAAPATATNTLLRRMVTDL